MPIESYEKKLSITKAGVISSVINATLVGIITTVKKIGSSNRILISLPGIKGTIEDSPIDLTDIPMLRAGFDENVEGLKQMGHYHPLKHIAEPEEIAQTVLFLAGSQPSFMTRAAINVNSGIGACLHDPVVAR